MDEEFESLVVTDPDLIDEGIDISGLRTQTDVSPYLLGNIPDYAGIQYEAFNPKRLSELMRLYSSGLPAIDTSTAAPPDTGGGGGGGEGTSPGTGIITPPADSIGGFDPGVVPGDSGFIGLDPDMDVDPFKYSDYGTYTSPTTPADTSVKVEDFSEPFPDFLGRLGERVSYPGDQSGTIKELPVIGEYDDVTTVEGPLSKVRPPGFPQDYSVTGALGVDPLEKDDVLSGAITAKDAADPGFLSKIGLGQFDPAEAFVKAALNKAVGLPVSFLIDFLADALPPQDPRVGALNEFYTTGAGAQYMDPSSPNYIPGMENYNIISGGFLNTITGGKVGDPTTYGLQGAYEKRSDNISETLQDKYGLTDAEIASVKAGNITDAIKDKAYNETLGKTTNLLENLSNIEKAKKAEKKRLDIFSGDIDERDQMLEDLSTDSLQGKINLGIQEADDDKGDDMLDTFDTTPADTTNIVDEVALTGGKDKDDKPAPSTPSFDPGDYGDQSSGEGEFGSTPGTSTGVNPFEDIKTDLDAYSKPTTGTTKPGEKGGTDSPSSPSGGNPCCFIMLEARYGDGTMDKVVRRYRDENMTPRNRRGYHKVAEVLVPLMRKSKIFKWIVTKTFADPLVSYGKWYYGENKHGWIFAPIKSAWLKLFDVVGTDTVFIRENGEEV